ncbi:MAG TPA: DUF4395 domain-containing protein [Acidimicrobiales bacterium]|jgi:hypothetical protein
MRSVFGFPHPVNEIAARVVAGGVFILAVAAIAFQEPWLLVPLAYGFWARVLTGPKLSPLGQLATRVIAPRLSASPRLVAGPPKRFAQAMGVVFSTTALILWFGAGEGAATWVVVGLLATAALAESAFGFCIGCRVFGRLMKLGIVPAEVCAACADISLRHPEIRQQPAGG